jgi:hypothetical protein
MTDAERLEGMKRVDELVAELNRCREEIQGRPASFTKAQNALCQAESKFEMAIRDLFGVSVTVTD